MNLWPGSYRRRSGRASSRDPTGSIEQVASGRGQEALTQPTVRTRLATTAIVVANAVRVALCLALIGLAAGLPADAQQTRRNRNQPGLRDVPTGQPVVRSFASDETVYADISTRTVPVTSSFSGTEIVVFGAVDHNRQKSAEAGIYDVAIMVEGAPASIVSRRKSQIGGIWLNTEAVTFDAVPSFYALVSTRPLADFASNELLQENDIGFAHLRMIPRQSPANWLTAAEIEPFRDAILRIKTRERLYLQNGFGASFIAPNLFRASIVLPANAPVGLFDTRVFLFREGRLLSQYSVRLNLQREGFERLTYAFANGQPLLYGVTTVATALLLGLAASALVRRAGS